MEKFNPLLYVITDSESFTEDEFLRRVEQALIGGATLMQLREKNRSGLEYYRLAKKVHDITSKYSVPLIIDDRLDVALAADCEGVHLGQSDLPVDAARKIAGDKFIIGATAKTVEQAETAYRMGADYLGSGAVYPTTTHVVTRITPVETIDAICRAVPIPVNAIGGLTKDNLGVLEGVGIKGVCVVSAVMKADDPRTAAKELLRAADALINGKTEGLR